LGINTHRGFFLKLVKLNQVNTPIFEETVNSFDKWKTHSEEVKEKKIKDY
jgi:hypothetical protein